MTQERTARPKKRQYVHFDRPLTLRHETRLMNDAGFSSVRAVDSIDGATIIICTK